MVSTFDDRARSDDEDQVRSVRAALSLYVGGALPPELIGTADANGLPTGGWVFPPQAPVAARHEDLSVDLADAGVLLREHAEALGVTMLVPGDPGWPAGTGADDLPALWVTGDPDVAGLLRRSVTIAGDHRSGTAYGAQVAADLGVGLAEAGWTIVASGFPDGIAAAAASWVRAVDGRLLLVDAHGPGTRATSTRAGAYSVSAPLGRRISPFPPGTFASRSRFAVHHRLLGTLCTATVVVETGRDTPSLAAARGAAETGRVVCAVPGPVTSFVSRGPHDLIASGTARLVASAADVIAAVDNHRPLAGGRVLYRISATASWDDGRWRSRKVPDFFVDADSAYRAADRAFEVVFTARPEPCGDTLAAGVFGPDGYEAVQVSSTT